MIRILCIVCIAVLWVGIIAIAEIYCGAFLKKNILTLLSDSKTYEQGYEYYKEQVGNVKQPVAISVDSVFNVLTQQRFYVAKLNFAEHALEGQEYHYRQEPFEKELSEHLKDVVNEANQQISVQEEQQIDSYAKEIVQLFYESANSTILDSIYEMRTQYFGFIKWLLPILLLCSIQFIMALFRVNSSKDSSVRDICYASIVSVLISIVMYIGLSIWLRPENFMTGPDFYQTFVKSYIANINQTFGYGILLLSLLYCLLIAVRQLLTGYLKKN